MKIIKTWVRKFVLEHYHFTLEKMDKDFFSSADNQILYQLVKSVHSLEGDMAELGVYQGESAKFILEAEREKTLHLFDTWKGLPEVSENDSPVLYKGQFYKENLLENTKKYLTEYKNVRFYEGLFPETAGEVEDKKFAFVHLDADLYLSMLSGLKFFYSRMSRGGIIAIHDYYATEGSEGIKMAVDEFLKNKPEVLIQVFRNRVIIVKQ
ncbi:MAG: TylF/MycF/NovP-related O-methyltransferase [bacterium]